MTQGPIEMVLLHASPLVHDCTLAPPNSQLEEAICVSILEGRAERQAVQQVCVLVRACAVCGAV